MAAGQTAGVSACAQLKRKSAIVLAILHAGLDLELKFKKMFTITRLSGFFRK
jgi:hypothetical protein